MNYLYEDKVLKIKDFSQPIPPEILEEVESVIIEEGAQSIPYGYFKKANHLVVVKLPKSMRVIEEYAFLGCAKLQKINLENVVELQTGAFKGDLELVNVDIRSVEEMGIEVFSMCTNLQNVLFSNKINIVPRKTFYGCTNLNDFSLPQNIRTIGYMSFGSSGIRNINLEFVKKIEGNAFQSCKKLQVVNIDNVKELGDYAFENSALTSIIVKCDTVSTSCFQNCKNLKIVDITNVANLNYAAFKNSGIEKVAIYNIESMGGEVFCECHKLKSALLLVSKIPYSTFKNCTKLESISSTCTSIEKMAFQNCSQLINTNFPQLKYVGLFAFCGCSSLRVFDFSKIKELDAYAFGECTMLEGVDGKIDLSHVEKIKEYAFTKCDNIVSVIYPPLDIPPYAFNSCKRLKHIDIADGVKVINEYAFQCCKSLEIVNLPESIEDIYSGAFGECGALYSINLPNNIREIKSGTFLRCTALHNIILPNKLEVVEESAFSFSGLENIDFPNSIKTISYNAFSGNNNLVSVFIPKLNSLSRTSFYDCANLAQIKVPSTLIQNLNSSYEKDSVIRNTFFSNNDFRNFIIYDDEYEYSFIMNDNETLKNMYCVEVENIKYYCAITTKGILIKSHNFDRNLSHENLKKIPYYENIYSIDYFNFYNYDKDFRIMKFLQMQIYLFVNGRENQAILMVPSFVLDEEKYEKFLDKQVYYEKLIRKFAPKDISDEIVFFKLVYNLGLFEKDDKLSINVMNFLNKIFFHDAFITNENIGDKLSGLKLMQNISPKFLNFFKSNYKDFEKDNDSKLLVYAINHFDDLSKNLSKVDYDSVKDFIVLDYENIDNGNEKLARIAKLSGYGQKEFESLQELYNKSKNMPKNVFEEIDRINEEISSEEKRIASEILDTVDAEFTFEWLSKDSEYNLVLGNICECCAKLGGAGFGIMQSVAIDPRVQNLAICEKGGDYVAKSTVYVNEMRQYAVFNNVVVKEKYREGKRAQGIFDAYMRGVQAFVNKYNDNHPLKPLLDVTVGMGYNKLNKIIRENLQKSPIIYKGAKFQGYAGDSSEEQYILYKSKNENLIER